ncbi:MAG: protein kinase [Acidobacteriota bacterium]
MNLPELLYTLPSAGALKLPEDPTLFDGKYTILAKLREGGMGTIYKVHHNLLDEVRVIKFMRAAVSGDPDLHRRFLQEAKLVTRFKHPNIAAVYDFAMDDDDTAYIVMEYVGGLNLNEMVGAVPTLSVALVLELMAQTLDALGYLHRKQVVHRDISPDNIMAVVEDDSLRVKLIDLGIAKALDASEAATKTGFFLGKLKYASPEQLGTLQGEERMDGRSDLYSLGVVMYQLLTGRMPFAGESAQALIAGHLIEPPAPFEKSDPDGRIPQPVRQLVMKTLAKKRDDRFSSAEEMRRAIVELQQMLPPDPLTQEAEQLRAAMREQDAQREASRTATPSAQERMNRRFTFAEVTPRPGTASSPTVDRNLEPTAPAPQRKGPPRAADPTQKAEASTLDATVAVQTPRKSWAARRWIAATSTAMIVLLASAVILRTGKQDAPLPQAGPTSVAVPQTTSSSTAASPTPPTLIVEAPDPSTSVMVSSESVGSTATSNGRVKERPPVVTTTRAPRETPATDPVARTRPAPSPIVSTEPPRTAAPPVATATRAPETTTTRPAEIERPREIAPPPAPQTRPAPPVPTAADDVRQTVAEFIAAQEALDPARYVAVFPSADRGRITAAFSSFRSQKLDLTINAVDVNGSRATVRAREQREAVPKVGNVQRVNSDRTITLERTNGKWVVVAIR